MLPIFVTLFGIVTDVIFAFPMNAVLPITVTGLPLIVLGMSYVVTVSPNVAFVILIPPFPSLSYVRRSSEAAGSWSAIALLPQYIVLTLLVSSKIFAPTVVTLLPMVIDSRSGQ